MKIFGKILALIFTLSTIVFVWLFIQRVGLNYNEEGLYFDELTGMVYHEQAKEVYGLLALILWVFTILILFWIKKK